MSAEEEQFGADLIARFDQLYVINLRERTDRRQQVEQQLRRIGLDFSHPKVTLFDACQPAASDGFPTPGAHGCFLSHLSVLRKARENGYKDIIVAEDDLEFGDIDQGAIDLLHRLDERPWHLFYPGYHFPERFLSDGTGLVDVGQRYDIGATHFYGVSARALDPLFAHLETLLAAPGPKLQADQALNSFRATIPDCVTLVISPAIARQRRSRSDVQSLKFYDRLQVLRPLANFLRLFAGSRRS